MHLSAVLCAALAVALAATDVLSAPPNKEEGSSSIKALDEAHANLGSPLLPGPGECGIQNSVSGSGDASANEADLREFPWVVMLLDSSGNNCTGALISKRYVVTSADCTAGKTVVRLGEHDIAKTMDCGADVRDGETVCTRDVEIAVEDITIHPEYTETDYFPNNIALVRLSSDVEFSASIRPICLPTSKMHDVSSYVNKRMWASGWNMTRMGWNTKKLKMLHTVVRVVDWPGNNASIHVLATCEKCAARHDRYGNYIGSIRTVGEPGNPLMWYDQLDTRTEPSWTLVGVKAYDSTDSQNVPPVGFTRVSHYVPWILGKIHA